MEQYSRNLKDGGYLYHFLRDVVISLSFDAQGEEKPLPWIEGWRCIYDLKTGKFSVPADFAEHNAKAVKSPGGPSE